MNLLQKALETNSEQIPSKAIDTMTGFPTAKEIAKSLHEKIYNSRYEYSDSFEFEFIKGSYSFYCDVTTRENGTKFETYCPMIFEDGDEIEVPAGFLYEIDFETKKYM